MLAGEQRGFTLYELLVTMLVAGIVLGVGVPNLLEFTRNGRMVAAANDYVSAVHLARGESVSRGAPVTLCASADPLAATPSCSADGSVTTGGYFAWIDDDSDAVAEAGEEILLQRGGTEGIAVYGDGGYVHFQPNGFVKAVPSAGSPASVVLFCDERGNVVTSGGRSAARAVRVPPTGRPATLVDVAEISALGLECP